VNIFPDEGYKVKVPPPLPEKQSLKRYSGGMFLILVLVLAMIGLLAMILLQWESLHQVNRILPASLLAVSTADYSGARPNGQVHVVGMAIVGDMVKELDGLQPADLKNRLASLTAVFQSPVPTATLPFGVTPRSTLLPTQEKSPQPGLAATRTNHPNATSVPVLPASSTPPVNPTLPPATVTVPESTSTLPPPAPKSSATPQPPTLQPPTSQPPTIQPPPPPPDPPKATKEPKPNKEPKAPKDKDPKPTKKPKK
jgi:hypothetical protein